MLPRILLKAKAYLVFPSFNSSYNDETKNEAVNEYDVQVRENITKH